MTIDALFSWIEMHKRQVEQLINQAKPVFKEYLQDEDLPILERWKMFCAAPVELREHSSMLWQANSEALQYMQQSYFRNPDRYGKGACVNLIKEFNSRLYNFLVI